MAGKWKSKAFLDTSYLLALELVRDQNHEQAERHWQRVPEASIQLVTTSLILTEVAAFLNSRGFHEKAVEVGNNLLQGISVQFIHIDEALLLEGWSYFQRHNDKDYSLVDCVSFVLMRTMNIATAFTFDRHFVQAGFIVEPEIS
jgi:predicted nucleic acid-binding protein